jgi:hypothetical protein
LRDQLIQVVDEVFAIAAGTPLQASAAQRTITGDRRRCNP